MDVKEYIRSKVKNPQWEKYIKSPRTYFFLEILSTLWRPGRLANYNKISLQFGIRLLRKAYSHTRPVIWTNVYTPPEMIWAWGGIPFMPEVAAAVAASLGQSVHFLKIAEAAWYSSDLCSFHRCALGMAMTRILPKPDLIIATSHLCDGAVKFLEICSRMYGCPFYLLHIPYQDIPKSRSWLAGELLALKNELKPFLPARPKVINQVMSYANEARTHMIAVNNLRKNVPSPWRGSEALNQVVILLNGLGAGEAVSFYQALEQALAYRVKNEQPLVSKQKHRLLWLHFKPFYANPLMDMLEIKYKNIIAFEEVNAVTWEEIPLNSCWEGIAAKILSNPLWGPGKRRIEHTLRLVREYSIRGVIHFSHWGCRQTTGLVAPLREALMQEGIPFLNLDGDCIDPRNFMEGQTATRVESFLEMLDTV